MKIKTHLWAKAQDTGVELTEELASAHREEKREGATAGEDNKTLIKWKIISWSLSVIIHSVWPVVVVV